MRLAYRICEARLLFHENFFIKITMQESIVDIKLLYRPMKGKCNGEDNPTSGWIDYRFESFSIIKAFLL